MLTNLDSLTPDSYQALQRLVNDKLLANQELLTDALYKASLYITQLEQALGKEPHEAATPAGRDYYEAYEILYRSEHGISPWTGPRAKPTFAPWIGNNLVDQLAASYGINS